MFQYYKHKPLEGGNIRLVTVYPGAGDITISFEQVPFSESEVPHYEALSYTWGDPISRDEVNVINFSARYWRKTSMVVVHDQPQRLLVTKNLHSALKNLREDEPRVLWIDALCINQIETSEKNREIWRMSWVYQLAWRVIVWLGESSEQTDSKLALDTLSHLGLQVTWDPEAFEMNCASDCEDGCEDWYEPTYALPYNEETWTAISHIFSSPWFTRIWIWQEIGFANQDRAILKCDQTSILWKDFAAAAAILECKVESGPSNKIEQERFKNGLAFIWEIVSGLSDKPMSGLLGSSRRNGCLDARDRVFAMLDLSIDGHALGIIPNYDDPLAKVYRDFAVQDCYMNEGLDILGECDARTWRGDFPSWVPNWAEPLSHRIRSRGHASSYRGPFEVHNNRTLAVKGVFCGSVERISGAAPSSLTQQNTGEFIRSWVAAKDIGFSRTSGDHAALAQASLNLEFLDRYPDNDGWLSCEEAVEAIQQIVKGGDEHSFTSVATLFLHISSQYLPGRKFFRTNTHDLGLAPSETLPGDIIYAILGCKSLLVLRPGVHDRYRIVGSCFLSGFMDLEALLGPLPPEFHIEEGNHGEWCYEMWFVNSKTGERSRFDPRLEGYPAGWKMTIRDEDDCIVWENIENGETTVFDPRHSDVSFLMERGVDIRGITLE